MKGHSLSEKQEIFFSHFLPPKVLAENTSLPPGLILLQDSGKKIFHEAISHISHWPENLKSKISKHLNLQFFPVNFNSQGNVCFADDPALRQEFRTHFTPVHLFDYYYAAWQVSVPAFDNISSDIKLRFPLIRSFWDLVLIGEVLRTTHLAPHPKNILFDLFPSDQDYSTTEFRKDQSRFSSEPLSKNGRLYLNDQFYIDKIPKQAAEYSISGYNPLKNWIEKHHQKKLTAKKIAEFSGLIIKIEETARWQKELRKEIKKQENR